VFGEKDFQQLLVIRRLVDDLGYPVRILPVATVREPGGLALSSRNQYLDSVERIAATALSAVLRDAAERVAGGMAGGMADHRAVEREAAEQLRLKGLRVDYVAVRRCSDLAEASPHERDLRVLAAAWCGRTRLIDNWPAGAPAASAVV